MNLKKLRDPSETFDAVFPQDKPFDVVGFGLNAVDHMCVVPQYPRFDTKTEILRYEKLAGGQVATTVTFVSRMGLKGKYIGKVGSDDLGKFSLQDLRSENIDTSSVLVEEGARNQYGFIIIDRNSGERTILWQRDPKLSFRDAELRREDICAGKVLHLDGQGAMAVVGDECVRFPAFKVHAVDTTGAGDIFHGGFIYGLLQNWPLDQIMTFANAAAGLNCTHLGARARIPPLFEILQLADSGAYHHI